MSTKIEDLIRTFQITFDQNPWYGKSIMDVLKQVDYRKINNKPGGSPHSIAQLLKHMIAWRTFAIIRLDQDPGFLIEMNSEEDWSSLMIQSEKEWEELIQELKESQEKILEILKTKEEESLNQLMPESKYTFMNLVEGVIQHDVYHLGQIAMLNKMLS
ncbi:MAG: DinB family protein [Bacteroidota bacterium]